MEYNLLIESPRPYFAEVPYYLWGTVNYDSEGDCKYPTDTAWSWLRLAHRRADEELYICGEGEQWSVSGDDPSAARVAMFLAARCNAKEINPDPSKHAGLWQHHEAIARADRVAAEFSSPKLKIFDSCLFWGSWKWIGWFATEFTWVGRWIMVSLLNGDTRGIPLCIDWLQQGTCNPNQSKALRLALYALTGKYYNTDAEWVRWYKGGLLKRGAKTKYQLPDFEAWLKELKQEYGDSQ